MTLGAPKIPFISNVSGTFILDAQATDPAYRGRQIREAVRFSSGASELLKKPDRVFLEVGPGNTLGTLVRRQATGKAAQMVFSTLRHAREEGSDTASMLCAVGRLWASGVSIDWAAFYGDESRRRVALPPYPFEGQRYPGPAAPGQGELTRPRAGRRPTAARPTSTAGSMRRPGGNASWRSRRRRLRADKKETWLVCLDGAGLGELMVERLERAGHDVIAVEASDRFRRVGAARYTVDPRSRDDYQMLFKELSGANQMPAVVLHLCGVSPSEGGEAAAREFQGDLGRGFGSLLAMAQALGDADVSTPVRLAVVTNDAFDVTGNELVAPGKAIAFGLQGHPAGIPDGVLPVHRSQLEQRRPH